MRCGSLGVAVVAFVWLAGVAHAQSALDKPPFTASAAELMTVAKTAPRGSDVVVLREDTELSYDDRGRLTSTWRMVFVVLTQAGADDWNIVSATWRPFYQDKPRIRGRVIDPKGRTVDFDQSLITDEPVIKGAPVDRRRVEAPLPLLQIGSVVEEQIVTTDREPLFGGGSAYSATLGNGVPTQSTRVRVVSSGKRKLHVVTRGLPATVKPKTETSGGRKVITYALGAMAANETYEGHLPPDSFVVPSITASPAASWADIARAYRGAVDKRIAEGVFALPAELPKTASVDTVRAVLAWLHRNVRHNDVGLFDSEYVPATPAEIVKRGTADAKDMATLLVALLRQTGMRADLVLVNTGPGPDSARLVPNVSFFDHVIVRARIGKTDVWIDPLAELTPPGQLPAHDQGRSALVIANDTTALLTSPAASARDNVVREVRTFELAEHGDAKVTEVSYEGGVFEPAQRVWIRDTTVEATRKNLTTYIEQEYKATKLDSYTSTPAEDLTKPFVITLVASGARRAYTDREQLDVYLFITDTLAKVPTLLSEPPDEETTRKHDLLLIEPHIYEIENRLIVPVGFTMPAPAPDKTRELGTFRLTETQRIDGRALVITYRLDTGKTRLTPAEVAKVQRAVRALRNEDAQHIVIAHTGSALAARGKYKDAIDEVQKLIKLHPKEALHHQQLAQVLIKAGLGDVARRAARKAVAVEPKNADAYVVLAWVLQHDSFGRWLGYDHDRKGALAALEKARKLDPTHVGAATDLASARERNAHGRRFDVGSDIRGAVQAWRVARELDDTMETAVSLATALMWTGEGAEAETILRELPAGERRDQLLITATAIASGSEAAVRFATSTGQKKIENLTAAAGILFLIRRYEEMRALFAETNAFQPNTPQYTLLSRVKRFDQPFKPTKRLEDVVVEMALGVVHPTRKTNVYWDKRVRDEVHAQQQKSTAVLRKNELLGTAMLEDLMRSTIQSTVQGDAGIWRVEVEQLGARSQIYIASDRGTPKVIGIADAPQGVGRHVLRLLAKNDEKNAERLLDWVLADLRATARANANTQRFVLVWGGTLPRNRKAMELAGAVLTDETDNDHAIPLLAQCKPTTTDGQLVCDWMLADAYRQKRRWTELEEHARAWAGRASKQLPYPTVAQAYALAHLGRFDDADLLVSEALAKDPDSRLLVFTHADMAVARGQLGEGIRRLEKLTKQSAPQSIELNNGAWLKLVEGNDLKGGLEMARKSVQLDSSSANALHTLAALELELGDLGEAQQHIAKSMELRGEGKPSSSDWYVHGRMLELLGMPDDAVAAYRQAKQEDHSFGFSPASFDLAQRRLKALGAKK